MSRIYESYLEAKEIAEGSTQVIARPEHVKVLWNILQDSVQESIDLKRQLDMLRVVDKDSD